MLSEKQIRQIDATIECAKGRLTLNTGGRVELPVEFGILEDSRAYQLHIVIECNEARWTRSPKRVR